MPQQTFNFDNSQPAVDRFVEYHNNNPAVFGYFRKFATDARNSGRKRFGARMIVERIRWYTAVEVKTNDGLKINNDYCAFYARLLVAVDPSFAEFFTFRDGPRVDINDSDLLQRCKVN